ncbi:FkbM family methyltransferase [Marinovum sp.]|uniref:FkbM family methyltransferase n=1 Tax=Marinovum sp. TaxID=2024839 RepID=UPI002B27766F|nr:FkbM family methyltransferase [Marinovum sp.]
MPVDPPPARGYIRSRGMRVPRAVGITTGRIRAALRAETFERKECEAVLRVVNEGDRVLELGGGIGYVSTLMAVARKVTQLVTYEANPALIPHIRRMHEANGAEHIDLRNALLTPLPSDPVPFYVRRNILSSSLDGSVNPDGVLQTVDVDCHAVEAVLEEVKPDVLICDIEGGEADLLPAADWSCLRVAVIELHPQWIGQPGVQAVFDAMQRAGLTYFPRASEGKVVTFRKPW